MAAGLKVHFPDERAVMLRALELARFGIGRVEPNPAVGAVVVDHELTLAGEGFHERFGAPHAEVQAIAHAGDAARGGTLFVTLEPCSHFGKTPPCTEAILRAGIKRVVVATGDPSSHAAGQGLEMLRQAGVRVEVGLLEPQARSLIAPFVMGLKEHRPFVHAKWAMTLDGRIASRSRSSQWISNEGSRRLAHELRGRMDAILVGIGTALADDPLLTARPAGPRTPLRIVLDSQARLPLTSKLVGSVREAPVLVAACSPGAAGDQVQFERRVIDLRTAGVEVLIFSGDATGLVPIGEFLLELGRRHMTNVLVEGGGTVHGAFFDARLIDEVHLFIAPKLIGGSNAVSAVLGTGLDSIPRQSMLDEQEVQVVDGDVYLRGRLNWSTMTLADTARNSTEIVQPIQPMCRPTL